MLFKSAKGMKTLYAKYLARTERSARKLKSADKLANGGVIVRKNDVLRHRYLRDRGLAHSPTLASVFTGRDRMGDRELVAGV